MDLGVLLASPTHTCSVCGDSYVDSYVPATGSVGLAYKVNPDGETFTVTGIGTCKDTDLVIGEEMGGYTVTAIGSNAFAENGSLTSITIPDTVTSIGDGAFSGCTGLTSIIIPDSVTSIGDRAFSGCTGLTSITIPDGVTSIGGEAFLGCSGLTSITIPDGVTGIGAFTFASCTGIESITIPDGVTSIGAAALLDNCNDHCMGVQRYV